MACKKCDPHEICEECPEWIFTLADLIMCMMGLFVILWVLKPSPGKEEQPQPLVMTDDLAETFGEIRAGFGWQPDPSSSDKIDQIMIRKRLKQQGKGEGGETTIERKGAEGTDTLVTSVRQGKQAIVGGKLLFEPGESKLTKETTRALDQIAQTIRGHRNIVLVKGHTSRDDLGEDGAGSAQEKMDLSLRRAQAVADYLIAHDVEPDILRVQGCGTFEPVIQRAYQANAQAQNRRVEVEVTAQLVSERQDAGAKAPPVPSH